MAALTAWKFHTADGAERAEDLLLQLSKQELITIEDAAVVIWREGAKAPKTRQLRNLAGGGAIGGAFWGLLFGLLFFVPILGIVLGATTGAIGGALADVGIDDDFIADLRRRIQPGTSTLFVMTSGTMADKVGPAFAALEPELIHSNLTLEQEARLREVFGAG